MGFLPTFLALSLFLGATTGQGWNGHVCEDLSDTCALVAEYMALGFGSLCEVPDPSNPGQDYGFHCPVTCDRCVQFDNVWFGGRHVMLAGGRAQAKGSDLGMRFFSLNETYPLAECLNDINNKTIDEIDGNTRRQTAVIKTEDNQPLWCGGVIKAGDCLVYNVTTDSWSQYSTTIGQGQGRAWDFTEEAGLILAGGGNPYPTIVEQSTDRGKTFQQIQTMPYGGNGNAFTAGRVVGACMVIIDATTVFLAGGFYSGTSFCDTWFLDLTDNTWTQGPDMTTCRHFQTCALVEDTNEIVILAGTTRPTSSSCKNVYRNSVEILDLGTKTFRSGTDFPWAGQASTVLPYEDSFLVMGGFQCDPSNCDDCRCRKCFRSDLIYKYNVGAESWDQLSISLPDPMAHSTAMYVDICTD